jgi:TonB-linked SusC/RagA family outer membrane protein
MRSKFTWMLTLFLALMVQITFAQEKTVTGNVTDQSGLPLPGVNVVVKGTTSGTQTDFDGNYAIKVSVGQTLVYTYLGQKTTERVVTSANTINVQMVEDAEALEEVVVTALGIERSARSLGYAVSTVKSEDLNVVRETNVLNALQGKASGVRIQNQSGNVGGSTKIIIRGNASLGGNNQPLWVVDGVPISDQNIATGSRIQGGFDFGNRAQDINPDDIESLSILKGASAAALYGSRAANGVIIVTTKKGKVGSKANFTLSTDIRFDDPLRLPDFQQQFVGGDQGVYDFAQGDGQQATAGWGPSLGEVAGQTYTNLAGEVVPFELFKNRVRDFYETGVTKITSFSASGASGVGDDYRLSSSYTEQQGILPNSSLNRFNLGLNAGKVLSEKLKSRFSVNYVRTNTRGTAAGGANDPNVLTNIVNGLPINTDISILRPWKDAQGNQLSQVGNNTNNPYWVANENAPEVTVERFFGNASLEYSPFEDLTILGRAGYDTFTDERLLVNEVNTVGRADGRFTDDLIKRSELTLDFLATYDKQINDDFAVTLRAGTQWNERIVRTARNTAIGLTVPGLFDPGNAGNNTPTKGFSKRRILGIFGDLTLDYKNWLILNATARNDFSSTLPADNNSFFYPSVSLSFVFTDALKIESDILSYGKLRGTWANVGNDTGPYLLDFLFNPDQNYFGQFGTGGTFPFNGQLAFNSNGFLTDPGLSPENQESFEVGVELGLFKNRVNIDATYYRNATQDQIIFLPTPQTSGYTSLLTNIGEISNKGFEIELNARVLEVGDFSWDIDYNFTRNLFRVEDLGDLPGGRYVLPDTEFNGLQIVADEGGDLELFGRKFARVEDADGNPIEDQILVNSDGLRQSGEDGKLGSINPDFIMGLTSAFNWKGFTLSATFDYREGGKIFSNTVGLLRRSGLAAETAVNNREVFVDPNTFQADGTPNTTPVSSVQDYWAAVANASIIEGNVFDATFIKWREVSLSYTFSQKILEKTPFKGLRVGIQGRNLALFNTNVPHIDPESGLFGANSNTQGIERGGVPPSRSLGFNLQVNF